MAGFGFGYGHRHSRRNTFQAGGTQVVESVSQFGATFSFAEPRQAGQYANGDWWVLGPVTFPSITPVGSIQASGNLTGIDRPFTNRVIHGTMVNPGVGNNYSQGWDNIKEAFTTPFSPSLIAPAYDAALNLDPGKTGAPLNVASGSVVKFVSMTDQADLDLQARPAGSDMVVLTVVDTVPASNSIRPGVSRASTASPARIAQFDLSKLNNFVPPATAPTPAQALAWVERYKETAMPDSINNTHYKGENNHPEYGRDIGNNIHRAMLALHLNYTAEEKLAIIANLAAIADDIISRYEEGGTTLGGGGGNQWKKPVVCMMGALLGSNIPSSWLTWLSAANNLVWGEDPQLFNVTAFDIALDRSSVGSPTGLTPPQGSGDGRPRDPFTWQMFGSAEWGEFHAQQPERSGSNWDAFYRDIVGYSLIGGLLALELTPGAKALWDNPRIWLYADTLFLRRTEGSPGNVILPFVMDMLNAHRPAKVTIPALVDAGIKDDAIWLRFDHAVNETAAAPVTGDFLVNVNGSPVAIIGVSVWRQNCGLALAAAVTGGDVVTVSYTSGANALRSVDGVNVPSFAGQALTNLSASVGGPNAAYPVIEFTPSVKRTIQQGGTLAAANNPRGTLALMKFRFDTVPTVNWRLLGFPSGIPPLRMNLNTNRTLELDITNSGGARIMRLATPALPVGTDLDILFSFDITQNTSADGVDCYVNGTLQTLNVVTWNSGPSVEIGWARNWPQALNVDSNATFRLGALWLDATARLDLSDAASRAKFTDVTAGNLVIGTLGDGITGNQPAQFLVGDTNQWNSGTGINRGTGSKFFPTSGLVTPISGGEWV